MRLVPSWTSTCAVIHFSEAHKTSLPVPASTAPWGKADVYPRDVVPGASEAPLPDAKVGHSPFSPQGSRVL